MIRVGRACSKTSRPAPPALAPPVSSDSGDLSSRDSSTSATCAPTAAQSSTHCNPKPPASRGGRSCLHAKPLPPAQHSPSGMQHCESASPPAAAAPRHSACAAHARRARAPGRRRGCRRGPSGWPPRAQARPARPPGPRPARRARTTRGPAAQRPCQRAHGSRARPLASARACWVTLKGTHSAILHMSCNMAVPQKGASAQPRLRKRLAGDRRACAAPQCDVRAMRGPPQARRGAPARRPACARRPCRAMRRPCRGRSGTRTRPSRRTAPPRPA